MRQVITRAIAFSAILICLALAISCESLSDLKTEKEEIPIIVGSWGAISSCWTDKDGKVSNYPELSSGQYYFTLDINEDGTYRQCSKSGNTITGLWEYSADTREYKDYPDGKDYYILRKITLSGKNTMSIFTDYHSSGTATENYVRISY